MAAGRETFGQLANQRKNQQDASSIASRFEFRSPTSHSPHCFEFRPPTSNSFPPSNSHPSATTMRAESSFPPVFPAFLRETLALCGLNRSYLTGTNWAAERLY